MTLKSFNELGTFVVCTTRCFSTKPVVGKLRPAGRMQTTRAFLCGPQGNHTHINKTHFESMNTFIN